MEKRHDYGTLNIFNADSDRCGFIRRTETDSSMSFLFSSAWLIRRTIQSNRALYSDLAMESRAVIACTNDTRLATKHQGPYSWKILVLRVAHSNKILRKFKEKILVKKKVIQKAS